MTITNVYFAAAYALWLYILLCFLGKLLLDRHRARVRAKWEQRIQEYFLPQPPSGVLREEALMRFPAETVLVSCACRSYLRNQPDYSPQRKEKLNATLKRLLRSARKANPRDTALFDAMERRCGIGSAERSGAC